MLKILLSNDDGINAQGIYHLADSLKELGLVTVVAPESERSASGHSITMHKPLRSKAIDFYPEGVEAWSINGTPSDCVKFALCSLMKEKPDLVVSGINHGSNLGTDVLYSGTVSAAIEGAIYGIPSIAVSLATFDKCDFAPYAKIAGGLCRQLYEQKIKTGLVMNINLPYVPVEDIRGIKITRLGSMQYKNCFVERVDPRGKIYFWLSGELEDSDNEADTDVSCIKGGSISITPIKHDLTSHETINEMKKWNLE